MQGNSPAPPTLPIRCRMDDYAQLVDMANEELTRREVRWCCVYCGEEVPDEGSPHCGEAGHTEAISEGDYDADF